MGDAERSVLLCEEALQTRIHRLQTIKGMAEECQNNIKAKRRQIAQIQKEIDGLDTQVAGHRKRHRDELQAYQQARLRQRFEIEKQESLKKDYTKTMRTSERLQESLAVLHSKIESGDMKSLNVDDVAVMLSETRLLSFLDVLVRTGVVTKSGSELSVVDEQFMIDQNLSEYLWRPGDRERLKFHIRFAAKNRALYDPKRDDTARRWDIQSVGRWLREIGCGAYEKHFADMKVCGITLVSMTKDMLVSELVKMHFELDYPRRRKLTQHVENVLWTKICQLRRDSGLGSDGLEASSPPPAAAGGRVDAPAGPSRGGTPRPASSSKAEVIDLSGLAEANRPGEVPAVEEKEEKDPPAQFLCPITQELMRDPVTCPDGATYEREALLEWVEANGTSPLTRQPLHSLQIFPNRALRDLIEAFVKENGISE